MPGVQNKVSELRSLRDSHLMSISIFSLSCPISDRCFAPFTAFSGDTLTAFPLCWAGYLLSSRDQGPLAPVLATRICISLMLEFVCLAMLPELHPLDRFHPVVLASADAGRRVFTGSETVTDDALRTGWRGSHSGAASTWLCQIRELRPFVGFAGTLPSSVSARARG